MNRCRVCGATMLMRRVDAKTCSSRCRQAFRRNGPGIPAELRLRHRWVRRTAKKVPVTIDGNPASSTDPATWTSYAEAITAKAGVGVGFVLNGEGIGCYDLDHCVVDGVVDPAAAEFVRSKNPFYVEISPSGDGLHAWVQSAAAAGWRRRVGTLAVEFYTQGRYITVTGMPVAI